MSILLSVVSSFLLSGEINLELKSSQLNISCSYWKPAAIRYEDIQELEFYESPNMGHRIIGFASPALCAGRYENSAFGSYLRYTYADCESCVVIRTEDEVFALNCEDRKTTHRLYRLLSDRMDP